MSDVLPLAPFGMVQFLKNVFLLLDHAPAASKVLGALVFLAAGFWMGFVTWRMSGTEEQRHARQQKRLREEIDVLRKRIEARKAAAKPPAGPGEGEVPSRDPGPPVHRLPVRRDDLTVIRGVTPDLENRLNGQGIFTLQQIASWSAEEAREMAVRIGAGRQILDEGWVEQAARKVGIAAGGGTAPAPIRVDPRVVDTEFRGEAVNVDPRLGVLYSRRPELVDDFTRIQVVGPMLQQKLRDLGVFRYKQVALWTPAHVREFAAQLEIDPERIETGHWVSQARRLHGDLYRKDVPWQVADPGVPVYQDVIRKRFPGEAVTVRPPYGIVYAEAPGDPDDLRRIEGVSEGMALELGRLGIHRFEQVAHWSEATVNAVAAWLHTTPDRIFRERWISQARTLADRVPPSAVVTAGNEEPAEEPVPEPEDPMRGFEGEPVRLDPDLGVVYLVRPDVVDDLTRIDGLTGPVEGTLQGQGIYRYRQIARWTDRIIDRLSARLGWDPAAIRGHRWVDRASEWDRKVYSEEATSWDEALPSAEAVAVRAAEWFPGEEPGVHPDHGIVFASTPARVDDLTRIPGISGPVAARLQGLGICRYGQVANWALGHVHAIARLLGVSAGQILRQEWIARAREFAEAERASVSAEPEAGTEVTEAAPPEPGVGETGPEAEEGKIIPWTTASPATAAAAATSGREGTEVDPALGAVFRTPPALVDDLKYIRGVGPLEEMRLRGAGIHRFWQIAAWTPAQEAEVGRRLGFGDRAVREAWVRQAGKLEILSEASRGDRYQARREVDQFEVVRAEFPGEDVRVDRDLGIVYGSAPAVRDHLGAIQGMDARSESALHGLGIHRFKQIAAWTDGNVAEVARRIGADKDRVEREKWVSQAVNLQRVIYAASPAWAEDSPSLEAYRRRAAEWFPGEPLEVTEDLGILYARRPARVDALTAIGGVDAEVESKLQAAGVYRYLQIAKWSARNVVGFAEWFGWHPDRIYQERWIAQAEELARKPVELSRETEPAVVASVAAAGTEEDPFVVLRRHFTDEPAVRVDRRFGIVYGEAPAEADDLALLGSSAPGAVAALHRLGIHRYRQVAHWTEANLREVVSVLGLDPSRIRDEGWQAEARRLDGEIYAASPVWSVSRPSLDDYQRRMDEAYADDGVGADEEFGILYPGRPEAYDDLKRIPGISAALEERPNASGVHRFKQIADWSEHNVRAFTTWLGLPAGAIYRQRWISRAARLAAESVPLRRAGAVPSVAQALDPAQVEALDRDFGPDEAVRIDRRFGIVYDDPPSVADDLKRLPGVTAELEQALRDHGVFRFKQIAAWNAANEAEFARVFGYSLEQLRSAGWIPASREWALHASGRRRTSWAVPVPSPAEWQERIRERFAGEAVRADEALGILFTRRPGRVDDLEAVPGIDARVARRLHASGVYQFRQIAQWSEGNVRNFASWLGVPEERLWAEDWIGQAMALADRVPEAESSSAAEPERPANPLVRYFTQPGVHWREDCGYVYEERPAVTDDLTRIHGVDAEMEARLQRHGIHRFWQVATWTKDVVEVLSGDLDLGNRIRRERWRAQARVLALLGCADEDGRFVAPAQVDVFAVLERDFAHEPDVRVDATFGIVYDQRPAVVDDLCRINGVTFALEEELHRSGIYRFKQIASWSDGVAGAFAAAARVEKERIETEKWIPQARWLHLRVYGQGSRWAEPKPAVDRYEERLAELFPGGGVRVDERLGYIATGRTRHRDDLTRIRGIGEALARRLQACGIHGFRQVAWWSDANIKALAARLGFHPDLPYRGQWMSQAAKLDAERPEPEDGTVAEEEPEPVPETVGLETDPELGPVFRERPEVGDDLKAIRGIGPKLERMLHGLGIYRYSQIAQWDDARVAAVSARMHFRERIQRERWVAQAKELAALREAEHQECFFAPAQLDQIAVVGKELPEEPGVRVDPFLGIVFDHPPTVADDLTVIDGIGRRLERELHQMGVYRYVQIAHWTDGNVTRVAENLSCLKDRIERDKWIPQARRLHRETYSASRAWGADAPSLADYQARIEEEFTGEAVRPHAELGIVYTGWPSHVDSLREIAGIDEKTERALNHLGIYCVKQIANWSVANVEAVARRLAFPVQRIYRDRWIFQAANLPCKEPVPVAPPPSGLDADLRRVLGWEQGVEADERLGLVYRERPVDVDPLECIKGLGTRWTPALHRLGVYRFRQIASWSDPQIDEFARRLGVGPGIRAANWVGQAREWAALAEEEAGTSFVAPSVVDQDAALEMEFADDEGVRVDELLGIVYDRVPPVLDDLSRISGIGGQMERELNELGVYRFKQIARWSDGNVAEFARRLFCQKERIERDKWIPQAKRWQRLRYAACPEWGSPRPSQAEWEEVARREFAGAKVRADLDFGVLFTERPRGVDDLKEIRGIGETRERELNAAGVWTFAQIAWWSAGTVEAFAKRLQIPEDRIYREGWIPEAADRARTLPRPTVSATSSPAPEAVVPAAREDSPEPAVPGARTPRRTPVPAPAPAVVAPVPAVPVPGDAVPGPEPVAVPRAEGRTRTVKEGPLGNAEGWQGNLDDFNGEDVEWDDSYGVIYLSRPARTDNLRQVRGIGPKFSEALNAVGVYRFKQIGGWGDVQIAAFARLLGLPLPRMIQEDWVRQARDLAGLRRRAEPRPAAARGSAAAPSRPAEEVPRTARERDARPEELVAHPEFGMVYRTPPPEVDDLTWIRGVGDKIADSLNNHGVYRFWQIAQWTRANAEAFAERLGQFGDRMFREQWMEQARRLHGEKYGPEGP